MSRFYLVDYMPTSVDHSLVGDLDVVMMDGDLHVLATTNYDGSLTRWTVTSDTMILNSTAEFDEGLLAGNSGSTTVVTFGAQTYALTGGARVGRLQLFNLDQADISQGVTALNSLAHPLAGITTTVTIGARNYVLAASGTENGVTIWEVDSSGALTQTDSIGTEDGLWGSALTAIETAVIDGQTYVILAAAGSGSLTVMSVDSAGKLEITDHIIDDLNSRFGGAAALSAVEHHGQIYVVTGGADDGLSLFLLQRDGTLQARGHIADTTQMGLSNVSAITAVSAGDGIDIFVASSQDAGVTRLHFDTGPQGVTLLSSPAGGTLTGSAGMDMIIGAAGNDVLLGRAGDDILSDGAGGDRLTGGAGADIFVFDYDGITDFVLDFELGVDRIDLSKWPQLRSLNQLSYSSRDDGIRIHYGEDNLVLRSADLQPIDSADFDAIDLLGTARIPQNMVAGFSGPAQAIPELPTRPDYTPYVYTPPAADPNPESTVAIPDDGRNDITASANYDPAPSTSVTTSNQKTYGTGDNDRLTGTSGADTIYGRGGSDWISGRAGNDKVWGESGADTLLGKKGNDQLLGGGGDTLIGGKGNDRL